MAGSDIVICEYSYTNSSSSDVFTCTDRYATKESLPSLDTTKNSVDIETGFYQYYDVIDGKMYGYFEAVFDRAVTSSDTNDQDVDLYMDAKQDAIWAYGEMSSGTPSVHGTTTSSRGST